MKLAKSQLQTLAQGYREDFIRRFICHLDRVFSERMKLIPDTEVWRLAWRTLKELHAMGFCMEHHVAALMEYVIVFQLNLASEPACKVLENQTLDRDKKILLLGNLALAQASSGRRAAQ